MEWPPGPEVQAQGERRIRQDDALILWHTELITQLLHALQSPGYRQSGLIMQRHATAVPPTEKDGRK